MGQHNHKALLSSLLLYLPPSLPSHMDCWTNFGPSNGAAASVGRSVGRRIQKEHLQGGWNCVLRRARAIPAEQGKISGLIDFNRTRSFAWSVGRSVG